MVSASRLESAATNALLRAGVPLPHAAEQVALLLDAELRAIPSHGLLRLERIVRRLENGVADGHARGHHRWRSDTFLQVDGQRGLGPVVANAATSALAERARRHGTAVAAIGNSNHIGMLGWYVEALARQGFTAIALSTSEALVHPWGGRRAMVGTNPIAIAVPTGDDEPFMMDTATSIVSMGEIHDRAHRKELIPEDWALDENGTPTTDPQAAKRGAIAPFGGPKGYALGLAFELLVSSLAGSALGREVKGTLDDDAVCNKGDLFVLIDGPAADLRPYLDALRSEPPAEGFSAVLVPGERGRACRAERLEKGVPVADSVWESLLRLADLPADAITTHPA